MRRNVMAALGIICCSVLTNELAYIIRRDTEISRVVVMDTPEGREAVEKLGSTLACDDIELVNEENARASGGEGFQVFVVVNPSDLHNSHEHMKSTLINEICKLSDLVDGILMLYGQCRCQTLDIDAVQSDCGVPVNFLIDRDDLIVDDCIAATLGGRRRYLEMMKRYKGAIFVTPGYVENYAHVHDGKDLGQLITEVEDLKVVLEYLGYNSLLKLDAQLDGYPEYEAMIEIFRRTFNVEVMTLSCNLAIFEDNYDRVKGEIMARVRGRQAQRAPVGVWG